MKKIRSLIIILTICILSFMLNVANAGTSPLLIEVKIPSGEIIIIDAEVADSCENIMQKIHDRGINIDGKVLRYKHNDSEFLPGTTINPALIEGDVFNVPDLYLLDIAIHGNSVLRKSATEASINIIADVAGNILYTVNENSTAPIDTSTLVQDGGAIGKNVTKTIDIPSGLLSSGPKYVHVVLKYIEKGTERYSSILTIPMPNDVYYFDDFEAYNLDAYPKFFQIKHDGDNLSFQKISYLDGTKVFNGYGTYDKGLDERIQINPISTGYAVLEADMKLSAFPDKFYSGGITIGEDYSNDTRNINALVNYSSDHKFCAGYIGGGKHISSIGVITYFNHHVKLIVDVANDKYDYYVDGVKANTEPINAESFSQLTWFGLYNGGDNTVYYDNIKFYAQATNPNMHSITEGTITNGTVTVDKETALQGETVTITATPVTGYRVKSVKINGSTTGITATATNYTFVMPNVNVEVTAEFEKIPYTVTVGEETGVTITPSGTINLFYGDNQNITIAANAGYKLTSVLVNSVEKLSTLVGDVLSLTDIQENKNIVVTAEEMKTVTIGTITNGTVVTNKVSAVPGENVTLTVTPTSGYRVKSVRIKGITTGITATATNYTFEMPNVDVEVTVEFEKISYTVTVGEEAGVTITPSGTINVFYGDNRDITIAANAGYKLTSVLVNSVEKLSTLVGDVLSLTDIQENKNIVVTAEEMKTVTIGTITNGTVVTDKLSAVPGETVTLTVTPTSGYRLASISILDKFGEMPVSLVSNYTFIMPSYNVFIKADFSLIPTGGGSYTPSYKISAETSENGSISPNTISVKKNRDKEFTITPDEGYEIENVIVDGESVGPVKTYKFENITKKHTIKAIFKKIEEAPVIVEPKSYNDVAENDWYYDSIMYVTKKGIMEGVGNDSFNPTAKTTRATMVRILYNLENKPAILNNHSFDDVDDDKWYADSIAWAKENNIVNGFEDGTFGPDKEITREQMSKIIMNYIDYKKIEKPHQISELSFKDSDQISSWAKESVKLVKNMRIMQGKDNNVFDALGFATRAELSTMIMNFCENVK